MSFYQILEHSIAATELSHLRSKSSSTGDFRRAMDRISFLLSVEATRHLHTSNVHIETPLMETEGYVLSSEIILVPILRAGLGLLPGFLSLLPDARVGHIGMYRDEETFEPMVYYKNIPDAADKHCVFILDPMLATGGSACDTIREIKAHGAKNIHLICVIAAPEGLEKVHEQHPDVEILTAAVDKELNEHAFILPGLGDAGDRYFGT